MDFPVPGGSVLVSCRVDDFVTDASGAFVLDAKGRKQLIPHGYVRQYEQYQALIRSHLDAMAAGGQQRLGVAVAYLTGGDTFALDCTAGELTKQDAWNLTNLIQDAIARDFAEIVIEMIPEWEMSYDNWQNETIQGQGNARTFQPLLYARLLTFTHSVWQAARFAAASVGSKTANLYIDLLAECTNTDVGSRLWSDWCDLHPDPQDPATKIGLSMIPGPAAVADIAKIYTNGRLPLVWNGHFYHPGDWATFKVQLLAAGYQQGLISGETSCDDAAMAQAFAADPTGLYWLLQWPFLTGATPEGVSQDRLTLSYANYHAAGQ